MKVGELVRIKRASIGVPYDSLAMVIQDFVTGASGIGYWNIRFVGGKLNGKTRRYLTRDLEKINNESR